MGAPSPHGPAQATWVEALPADFDPAAPRSPALPWLEASAAHYVVGVPRDLVMGTPGMSFADEAVAQAVAVRTGGRVVTWTTYTSTPPSP